MHNLSHPMSAPRLARRALTLTLLLGTAGVSGTSPAQTTPTTQPFGANVLVFNPSMPVKEIQATVDAIAAQQVSNQFGTARYALLFEPGVYGTAAQPLNFQVGFYTEVAGLGASPNDVTINGAINSYNQCFTNPDGTPGDCNALDNFWRSLSNLTINVAGQQGCHYGADFWAVSQASPLRRVKITGGNLSLMDYCDGSAEASGGFIADSDLPYVINGSQQQYFTRNSSLGGWSNGVWNQVFAGVVGAPAQSYPNPTYTTLASTPVSREKPFLTVDATGSYSVFVPAVQRNAAGTTWSTGTPAGTSLPLSRFFLAQPTTPVGEINLALLLGKNLILTPGVYHLNAPLVIERPNTVILGLGLATLVPQKGTEAITVADVDGVNISGLIVDAGPVNSPVLLKMGFGLPGLPLPRGGFFSHVSNPSSLHDVYFRVGGATPGKATTSLEINSADVLIDDTWAWRADHGVPTSVGWTANTASHGLVVNGDRVTALGLAVEHYQKEQVLWNGNAGETLFYQSELPYDVPSQSAWTSSTTDTMTHSTANGYPSYVVTNLAGTHQAHGLGIYSYFNQGVPIIEDNAITVPSTPGITVQDAGTVFLNGSGQITHVLNGVGPTAESQTAGQLQPVVSFP